VRGVGLKRSRLDCLTGTVLDKVRYDFIDLYSCLAKGCSGEDQKMDPNRQDWWFIYCMLKFHLVLESTRKPYQHNVALAMK